MKDILINHWAELLLATMALFKVIVNITPTEKDNKVFTLIDRLIDGFIPDRRKR